MVDGIRKAQLITTFEQDIPVWAKRFYPRLNNDVAPDRERQMGET